MQCFWCGQEIEGDYLQYDNKIFCERLNDKCIKEYLLNIADNKIEHGYYETEEEWKFHELCKRREY